jgi:hypothetical protein
MQNDQPAVMEIDLEGQLAGRADPILASLIVPHTIALVTTVSQEGTINAAPFSVFNVLGSADTGDWAGRPGRWHAQGYGLTHADSRITCQLGVQGMLQRCKLIPAEVNQPTNALTVP